jgi:hypothetical protein
MPLESPSIIDYTTTQFVDAPLTRIVGVATATLSILPIKVGNTLIIGKCRKIALRLYKIQ